MKRILVVANETVAGKPLIDAVRERAAGEPVEVHVICPQNQPRHGYVIYDSMVRDAAENRLQMTIALLHGAGIEADGEVMDPDPYAAVMDALGERDYDEIIISTHPETRSGWLREGLVDRVRRAARRPVEHVVVDLDAERDDVKRTLVVANETVASPELLDLLRRKAAGEPRRFIVIAPQSGGNGNGGGAAAAAERLAETLKALEDAGLEAIGQVVHPDPYTAAQHVVNDERVDEIIVSTFPGEKSGWLRRDLVQRLRKDTGLPVEHVISPS
jgi:hypothetical protein